jgi:hypothetical protein
MTDNLVPGSGVIGWGFDIFGAYDASSAKSQLFALQKSNSTYQMPGTDKVYAVPGNTDLAVVGRGKTRTYFFETRLALQTHFAQEAGLSGKASLEFGSFSGEWNENFNISASSESSYVYALMSSHYTNYSLRLTGQDQAALTEAAQADLGQLPPQFTTENQQQFFDFFGKYGTHFVSEVTVGGKLYYWFAVLKTFSSASVEIKDNAKLEFDALFVADGKAKSKLDWDATAKGWFNSRQVTIDVVGGTPGDLNIDAPSFGENRGTQYTDWFDSISQFPVPIGFGLRPVYEILSIDKQQAMQDAMNACLTRNVISIQTQAKQSRNGEQPTVPVVVLGIPVAPKTPPENANGFQVVITAVNEYGDPGVTSLV